MKHIKMLSLALLSAMAVIASTASTASATTLEVGGVAKTDSVAITMSYTSETSSLMGTTSGGFERTCTGSDLQVSTVAPYTSSTVSGPISNLTLTGCTVEPATVHKPGTLHIEHIAGTTNGTVRSRVQK